MDASKWIKNMLLLYTFMLVFTQVGADDQDEKFSEFQLNFWSGVKLGATAVASFLAVSVTLFVGFKLIMLVRDWMNNRVVDNPDVVFLSSDEKISTEESKLETDTIEADRPIADTSESMARSAAALPEGGGMDMRKHPFVFEYHFFKLLGLIEIQSSNICFSKKLGEGAFGTIFSGELITTETSNKSTVTVKSLRGNVLKKEKYNFIKQVKILSCLRDPNFARVLGVCVDEQSLGVVLETLEFGDLCRFLQKCDLITKEVYKKLQWNDFLFIFCQLASGMEFLVKKKIVHMDIAARNCIVGKGLRVKLSYFAKDMEAYDADYCLVDTVARLPLRWMSWESVFKVSGKYTEKSDVWSFGVLIWEALTFCRHTPYPHMDNDDVLINLGFVGYYSNFCFLEKLTEISDELYTLLLSMWSRDEEERPTFQEVHSILYSTFSSKDLVLVSSKDRTIAQSVVNVHENPLSTLR